MISLHRLPPDRLGRLAGLRLSDGQDRFVGTGAEMILDPTEGVTFHEIRDEAGQAVGMFKLDPLYWQRHDFADAGDVGLRGFLIDACAQGHGHGSAALGLLAAHVRAEMPDRRQLVLTVNEDNPVAYRTYLRAGFEDRGGRYLGGLHGPQHILWLALR